MLQSIVEQARAHTLRVRSIYHSHTVGQLMDAIENTYYDIFLEDGDVAYSYFTRKGNQIFAQIMQREDPTDTDSWTDSGIEIEVYADKPLIVIGYPEDTVCCLSA